jgi:hypothetical protein
MAATETPLVWDFYRTVGAVDGIAGSVHYFDNAGQSIYLNGGIATQVTQVDSGQWETAVYGDEIVVDDTAYTLLTIDHPYNGILHMAATDGTTLYYLRYVYAMDISDSIKAGKWKEQTDNKIKQLALTLKNTGPDVFAYDETLFNPGAKVTLALAMGNSENYPIGVIFLDDSDYDLYSDTVPLSGRNAVGFKLAGQTFDETTEITGYAHEVAAAILALAGITSYHLQEGDHNWTHTFKPEQTLLSGLQQLMEFYIGWEMAELDDGTIVMGYPAYVQQYIKNSVYTFNGGSEVKKRKTTKTADAAYVRVRVTGKDNTGADLTPVYADVQHWTHWQLGAHKTKHITAPDGLTQDELAAYATQAAADLQYVGIGEQFTGPIRPHLLVGDVAEVYYEGDEDGTSLGLITDLTHSFGDDGFWTDFSVDSGGVTTDGEDYVITRNAALRGYNRRQTLADLIGVIAAGR